MFHVQHDQVPAPTPATPMPRWRRARVEHERCLVLELPAGVLLAVVLRRAWRSGLPLWDVHTRSAANPCDDRGYRCTSWRAARGVIEAELLRLGWPA